MRGPESPSFLHAPKSLRVLVLSPTTSGFRSKAKSWAGQVAPANPGRLPTPTLPTPVENLLCAQHPRQLFNPSDSPGSGYHYSPLFIEHTAQRGGEMPRSRSEGIGGEGGGCCQHLPLAVLTGPTVPLGSPSFGIQEIQGLAIRGSLLPGSGFRQKAPCLPSSSQGAAPSPAPGTPALCFQIFPPHLWWETRPHNSPCARLRGDRVGRL